MKKYFKLLMISSLVFITSGCFKTDSMDDIEIYTSVYPVEFITSSIYGDHADVNSIYPDGIVVNSYELTDKLISDYSEGDLLIYNGLGEEKEYAKDMLNKNKKMKIIDVSMGMEYTSGIEELWLDPSNFLMMAQNIRMGFKQYITNKYLEKEIDENYDKLKLQASELDAELKLIVENADNKTLIVSNDMFKYLEKYGLEIISLEENDNLTDKMKSDANKLITSDKINYIFIKKYEQVNNTIQNLLNTTNVNLLTIDTLSSISEDDRENKETYISLMKKNIELFKKELYQ
ncbi:MAG: metal ABC transporter substrate-binding protein [Bacilli bacterium]